MKRLAALAIGVGLVAVCWAQDSIVGVYKGSFTFVGPAGTQVPIGVTLVIDKAEEGRIAGTGSYHGGSCRGDYPFAGFIKGDTIGLKSTGPGTGRGGDCVFGLRGKIEGRQIVGNIGRYDLTLSK